MENTSWIEISESALANNLDYIRGKVPGSCLVSHVVKGNAYGHGFEVFAPLAAQHGARHFSVFDAFEAYQLKAVLPAECTIMIMGMVEGDQLRWAIENEVEFFVFDQERLVSAINLAREMRSKARIHLHFETGMNRMGFEKERWNEVAMICQQGMDHLEIMGFCTHYAGAEHIANHIRIGRQIKQFKLAVEFFRSRGLKAYRRHTACSAAVMRLPNTQMDMVRVGIMQYGFWPSQETYIASIEGDADAPQNPLQCVMTWKSRVMSIKPVKRGEYIGYGTSFLAPQDSTIAIVPVGYYHGFSRSMSNKGRALVRGERVPVIGVINMNAMILDVSCLDSVEKGDEVVLIGKQGELNISVSSFSDYSNLLNYELLTRLPKDIPRHVTT